MSNPAAITTPLRLSASEIRLIIPGLSRICANRFNWNGLEKSHWSTSERRASRRPAFDDQPPAAIPALLKWKLSAKVAKTSRLHLDAFELAAGILTVRVTNRLVCHRHIWGWFPNHKATTRRVLNKLGRLRKRAKRAFIRTHGHAAFAERSRHWKQFIRVARSESLSCSCERPLLPTIGTKKRRQQIVAFWLDRFQSELPASGLIVRPEKGLRAFARRALRSARRLMRRLGWRAVHGRPGLLSDRIREFVARRCSAAEAVALRESGPSKPASEEGTNAGRKSMPASMRTQEPKAKAVGEKILSTPKAVRGAESRAERRARRDVRSEPSPAPAGNTAPVEVICIKASDDPRPPDIGDEAEIVQLYSDWPYLSALERGLRLKALVDVGNSRRALARELGCSEGLVRQLIRLTELTEDEGQCLKTGKLSCKQVLKTIQARKVQERQEQLAADQQERAKQIDLLVAAAVEWLLFSLALPGSYRTQLIEELRWGPYRARRCDLAEETLQRWQIPMGRDPRKVIRRTRPEGDTPPYGPNLINYYVRWYGRWSQRLMPGAELRDAVMEQAARELSQHALLR